MEGLIEGRIVHFAVSGFNEARAAVITHVWNEQGTVNLFIFPDGSFQMDNQTPTSVTYDEAGNPGTWHWIPKA